MVLSIFSVLSQPQLTKSADFDSPRRSKWLRQRVGGHLDYSTWIACIILVTITFVGGLQAQHMGMYSTSSNSGGDLPPRISYFMSDGLILDCLIAGGNSYRTSLSKEKTANEMDPSIYWYKLSDKGVGVALETKNFPVDSYYSIINSKLHILAVPNTKLTDLKRIKGSYYCQKQIERYVVIRSRTCIVNPVISAYSANKIHISADSASVYKGGTAVLTCKIQPEYARDYYRVVGWQLLTKDGRVKGEITNTTKKYSVVKSIYPSELHIRQTGEADTQIGYRCIVESLIRQYDQNRRSQKLSPRMSVTLIQGGVASFTPYLRSSHVHLQISGRSGTDIELPCVFYGINSNSGFQYVWRRGKETIYPLSKAHEIRWKTKYEIVAERHGNLRITNLNKDDQGEYRCSLMNEGSKYPKNTRKQKFASIILTVSSPLTVKVKPPRRSVDFKSKTSFTCEVHGYPLSQVYWLKNGKHLSASSNIKFSANNRKLIIEKVGRTDAGVYQCFAQTGSRASPDDNAQSGTLLEVQKMPPILILQKPTKEIGRESGYVKLAHVLNKKPGKYPTSVTLFCNFQGSPHLKITWYLDDMRIPLDVAGINVDNPPWDKLTVDVSKEYVKPKNKFRIADRYAGMYRAVAENEYGRAECKNYVEVDAEMEIRDFEPQTPIEGEVFRLKCFVLGNGAYKDLQIMWTKKDKRTRVISKLPNNHRHEVEDYGRTLLIRNVKKEEDDGTYECTAINKAGRRVSKSIDLNVSRSPVINPFESFYHLDEDVDKVTITCNIKNQANKPWYAWWVFKDSERNITKVLRDSSKIEGVEITYSQGPTREFQMPPGVPKGLPPNKWVMLEIEKPDKAKHSGNYSCHIVNKVGRSVRNATVTFKPKIKFDLQPPAEKEVTLSSDLRLNCTAKGKKPKPIVEWKYYNDSGSVYTSVHTLKDKTGNRIMQLRNGTLVVKNISRNDPTQYMCFVSLKVSDAEAISKVVKVIVHYPAYIRPMKNEERRVGQGFNLSCYMEGDGEIETKWLYFDEHAGIYNVITVPCISRGDPQTIPCTINENTADYPILTNIFRRKFKPPHDHAIVHRLTFSSVSPGHPKLYKCMARNKYNTNGVWAERVVRLTVIDTPSKPINIASSKFSARSITLTWSPPETDGNKPILYYRVTYSRYKDVNIRQDILNEINVTSVKDKMTYSQVIKDLHPAYEYRLEVQAVNAVGFSKVASITQRTLEDKPSGPVRNISANGTSSNTIRVSWLEPAPDKVNGRLTSYSVCLMKAEADSSSRDATDIQKLNWRRKKNICQLINLRAAKDHLSSTPPYTEFNTLPKFTKYYIRVYARNNVGDGPPAFTSARTLEDVPREPPVEVTCTPGKTSVRLQWNPPKQDSMNGILTGYTIQYFETNDYEDESQSKINNVSSSTTVEVRNLRIFTNYTFRIFAVNSKGSGPPSEPKVCLTNPSNPDSPKEMKLFAVNSTCLVVSWRPPVNSNGRLTNYEVEYWRQHDEGNKETAIVQANISAYFNYKFLCHMDLDTLYYVRVRAKNHAPLYSDYTPMKSAKPLLDVPARLLAFNQSVTTIDNVDLSLSCKYIGTESQLTHTWKWKPENEDEKTLIGGTWLHLKSISPDQRGNYTCSVSNTYGRDQVVYKVDVHVIKKTPPNPPLLSRGPQRLHSLEVEWVPAGSTQTKMKGMPIENYWLSYFNLVTKKKETIKLPPTNRTYFLSKLTCATVVRFTIKAQNNVGKSQPSNVVRMRTKGSLPIPGDVTKLYEPPSRLSRTSVYINLSAVFAAGDGCLPLRYKIWLAPVTMPRTDGHREIIVNHEDLENQCCYNITNLNTGSHYKYKIEASNAAGGTNISGQLITLNSDGSIPALTISHKKTQTSFWRQPPFLVGLIFAVVIFIAVALCLLLIWRRRQITLRLQGEKGPVNTCVNDLKGDEGKPESGLRHHFVPPHLSGQIPNSQIRPRPENDIEEDLSDDGSVDSDGNINPYATFATYESNTLDRTEHTDGGPKELGAVSFASGQMRERMLPHNPSRRRHPRPMYYEAQGLPKQYENESVPGTLTAKRRSNSMEDIESAYNRGYATGGGGQMGRSYYDSKYTDGLTPYRGSSVISSTTMSSNHDELSQAYEYGRRARMESGLHSQDVEDNLDLHTGSGSSETTDPGIRQFTQQPPMPDEQRQATCEVPLVINQRRTSLNPSETYEAVDEAYYKRGINRLPINHPERKAPLPELPSLSTTTLGRPRMTAAGIRAGQFRNRADSDSVYGGPSHVYDSTDSYYSSYTPSNFGRRPIGAAGAGAEYPPRQRNVPPSRYYNGAGAAAERRPLVGATAAATAAVPRPLPYRAQAIPGADPEESRSLLMNNRRYSGSRGRDSGVGTSGGDSSSSIPPLSSRRPSRPVASVARHEGGPILQAPPRPDNSDSEGENIYTSEFTVV